MDNKKYITIGVVVVFILSLVIYFRGREEVVVDDQEEIVLDERRQELEEMKDKDFYGDFLLNHLGWTKGELVEKYGEPDETNPHYLGGEGFYYNDLSTKFVFSGEEGVVNNLYLYSGAEILGIRVGMTTEEIEDVLGEPRSKGFDPAYGKYTMTYFLGEQRDGSGELELWIDMEDEKAPSERVDVLWKKYWE